MPAIHKYIRFNTQIYTVHKCSLIFVIIGCEDKINFSIIHIHVQKTAKSPLFWGCIDLLYIFIRGFAWNYN